MFLCFTDQVFRWQGTKQQTCERLQKVSWSRCAPLFCLSVFSLVKFIWLPCVIHIFGCVHCVCLFAQRTSWTSWSKDWHKQRGCLTLSSPSWTHLLTGEAWVTCAVVSGCSQLGPPLPYISAWEMLVWNNPDAKSSYQFKCGSPLIPLLFYFNRHHQLSQLGCFSTKVLE